MTWWMLEHGVDVDDAGRGRRARRRAACSSPAPTRWRPTITVDGTDVAGRDPRQEVDRRGQRRSAPCRGPRPAARASSATIIGDGRHRRRGPRHRHRGVRRTPPVKVYLTADPDARAARRAAEQGGADVAATAAVDLLAPRPDRLRPGDRAAGDGRRTRVHIDTTPYTLDEVIDQSSRSWSGLGSGPGRDPQPPAAPGPAAHRRRRAPRAPAAAPAAAARRAAGADPAVRRPPCTASSHVPAPGRLHPGRQPHRPARRPAARGLSRPRPVHALTKQEMFQGCTGRFLRPSGRSRSTGSTPTPTAVKACLRVLRDGGVVGIFPEGSRGDGELRPVPPRGGLPGAGHRRAGRAGGGVRHPRARRHTDSVPPRGARSTWSTASRWRRATPWPRTAGRGTTRLVRCCGTGSLDHLVQAKAPHRAARCPGRSPADAETPTTPDPRTEGPSMTTDPEPGDRRPGRGPRARRRRPPQRRQVHAGQPDHRPPRGGRPGRPRRDPRPGLLRRQLERPRVHRRRHRRLGPGRPGPGRADRARRPRSPSASPTRCCSWSTRPSASPTPTRRSSRSCGSPASRSCSPPTRSTTSAPRPRPYGLWNLGLGEPYPVSALHGRGSGDMLDAILAALPEPPPESYGEVGGPRRVAIVGKPNVGKSSLLNKLAKEDRVVVDDVAGTTVDPVDELIELGGRTWRFIDTAGIRKRVKEASGPRVLRQPAHQHRDRARRGVRGGRRRLASRSPSRTCGSSPPSPRPAARW